MTAADAFAVTAALLLVAGGMFLAGILYARDARDLRLPPRRAAFLLGLALAAGLIAGPTAAYLALLLLKVLAQ